MPHSYNVCLDKRNSSGTPVVSMETRRRTLDPAWRSPLLTIEKMELIQKAKSAEQAEHNDNMATCMKALREQGAKMSNMVGGRRSTWRVISNIEQKTNASNKKLPLIKDYWEKVESYLRSICTTVLELLDKYLIASATNPESKIFYLKMKFIFGILLK